MDVFILQHYNIVLAQMTFAPTTFKARILPGWQLSGAIDECQIREIPQYKSSPNALRVRQTLS